MTCLRFLITSMMFMIAIPALSQQPRINCEISVLEISVDWVNLQYDPMPVPVTVTVTNDGDLLVDSLYATISFSPELTLAGEDAPDGYTKVCEKAWLFPKQSTTVQWMLTHPPVTEDKQYTVRVVVKTRNADSCVCEAEVIIPPLEYPILRPRDYCPNELVFVDSLDSYMPNPIEVRLTCVNVGNARADSVSGTLILPDGVVFDPPGQSKTQFFNPMSMEKWTIGDPVPEVIWTVRWTKRLRYYVQPEFRSVVTARNPGGILLDSTEVRCAVEIPGLLPFFTTWHEIPDSLGLRADGLDVEPNPFPVRFTVKNISHQVGSIDRIILYFPTSDGLSLSPMSPNPTSFDPQLTLDKGEEETFEWLIDVENRITRRGVKIQMIAYDDESNPLVCEHYLRIANLKTAMTQGLEASVRFLRCNSGAGTYEPSTFVITTELSNDGGAPLHEIEADLSWLDNSGLDLIEFDPDFSDNSNPKTKGLLSPGEDARFSWGFRVKHGNTTGIPQNITFNVDYGSRETPYVTNGCQTFVEIEPCNLTEIGEAPALAANCILYSNHPNPFAEWTTIRYALSQSVPVTLVVHDALGREVRCLRDAVFTHAGAHSERFDAAGLPPGLYFYRLHAGEEVRTRRMVVW